VNQLLHKAQSMLKASEVGEQTAVPDQVVRQNLRWATVYSLVSIAEGVWKLVELAHKIYDQEIELHDAPPLNEEGTELTS
jgi:hypothetical protein